MVQRTPSDDFGIQINEVSPMVQGGVDPTMHMKAKGINTNVAGGWFKIVGQAMGDQYRAAQARAETQGTVDEFAGVADSAERSNIFTRASYEQGVAKQRSITALNTFQSTAAQDMQPAAENNLNPDQYVVQQRAKLVELVNQHGEALDDQQYSALVTQADGALRSMGSAYTNFKLKYDKDQQEQGTNAVLALEQRNLAAARTPASYGPDGVPDTTGYMKTFEAGLRNLTSTRTPLNKDNLNSAVQTYVANASQNSTTDGVAGIKLMNDMYNRVTSDPSFGGLDPQQQQTVIKNLEAQRDRTAKDYMSELKQTLNSAKEGAEMDVPIDPQGVTQVVQNSERLLRMGFVTREQHSQIVAAADAARVADYKRQHKDGQQPTNAEDVLTSAQAKKAFKAEVQAWAAKDPSAGTQGARMYAIDQFAQKAVSSGNLDLQNVVSSEMADTVGGWENSPMGEDQKPTAADVGMMAMLANAYNNATDRNGLNLGKEWNMLTGGLTPAQNQALVQTLQANKGQSNEMLLKAYIERSKQAANFQAANISPAEVQSLMRGQPTANPWWSRVKDSVGMQRDRLFGFFTGSAVGSQAEQQARNATFMQQPWMAQISDILRTDPAKYNMLADKSGAIQQDAARALRNRSFDSPGVVYSTVVAPGVEHAVPGMRGIVDEASGQPTDMFQGYIEHRIEEFKAANPNHRGWLGVRVVPAGSSAVIEGLPLDDTNKGSVERLGIITADSLGKFQDVYYKKIAVRSESGQMQKTVVVPLGTGQQFPVPLTGFNRAGVDGKAFLNSQELSLALRPPAGTVPYNFKDVVQKQNEQAIGAADTAMKVLGVQRAVFGPQGSVPMPLERNYVALFTATEVAGGKGTADKLAHLIKSVRDNPQNVDEIRLEADVRNLFPRKISESDWSGKFIPQLRAVVNNAAYSMP